MVNGIEWSNADYPPISRYQDKKKNSSNHWDRICLPTTSKLSSG